MNKKTIYSVVDLEATGTDASADDRIIQFSCTFVQDQKIIDSFSTLINPLKAIPERITQLTGITNAMVKNAPSFRDIASLLYHMLQNTVFVAHNVNFDFPFLNYELKQIGYPQLKIKAIDTVTMSQILLPTLPSYQLRRISSYFNIIHKHPHSASSDAYATAYLLILLINRLRSLPYDTLKGIIKIQPKLPRNTMEMFKDTLQQVKDIHRPLSSYLRVKRGLVLRRNNINRRHDDKTTYKFPTSKPEKLRLYQSQLEWYPQQAKMMNEIYRNYTKDKKPSNWMFEVAMGMGRKIGYTLPLAYLSHNQHQVVIISTASKLLRKQLWDQTIPTLNNLLPFHVSKLIIKDSANYIDLNRYFNTLRVHEKSNQTQLVKAMILVWLTITTTGDLNELHINPKIPYLNEVRHYQDQTQHRHNPFYYQDFIRQHQIAAHRVNFIIVSHSYLCTHAKELSHLSKHPYLVIDEADKLPQAEISQYRFNFNLNLINIETRKIMGDLHQTHNHNLYDILPNHFTVRRKLKLIQGALAELSRAYQKIMYRFSITFLQRRLLTPVGKHMLTMPSLKKFQKYINKENPNFQVLNHDINIIKKITNYFQDMSGKRSYRRINRLEMDNYYHHVSMLINAKDMFNAIIDQIQSHPENCIFKAITNEPHNVASCYLKGGLISIGNHLEKDLYQYFRPMIFTDHALMVNGAKLTNSRMKLPLSNTRQKSDLDKISEAKPAINVYQTSSLFHQPDQYCKALATLILAKASKKPQRLLVGFSSLKLMTGTFNVLTDVDQVEEPVYALGINGSKKRILKRLTNAQRAIVFTNLTWFNQLNFNYPKEFGELIIADLPLDTNENMYYKAKVHQIKQSHQDVKRLMQLPEIILIIKRSLNYLPTHKNRLVIFDGRILNHPYFKQFARALPQGVIINQRKVKFNG
ncbi:exonuclease domain-containing protein [Acetilactobacillus jinshanensis]|nr:exonuclease domain-containing protein [Acetilactobacillus jinshanensis]